MNETNPAPADALRDRLAESEDIIDLLRIGSDNETDTVVDCMEAAKLIDLYDAALRATGEGK